MSEITVSRPESGASTAVASSAGGVLNLGFDPGTATASRIDNNLVFEVDGGGTVTLTDFFAVGDQTLPTLRLPDGTLVASADFFAGSDLDISTAAGPGAAGPPPGSGTNYADDTGSLMGGVDKLGQLGTDYWSSATEPGLIAEGPGATLVATAAATAEVTPPPPSYELIVGPGTGEWDGNADRQWVEDTYKQVWVETTYKEVVDVPGHEITVVDVPGRWENREIKPGETEIIKVPVEVTRAALAAGGNELFYSVMPNGTITTGGSPAANHSILVEAKNANGDVVTVNGNNNSLGVAGGGKIGTGNQLIVTPATSFDSETGNPFVYSSQMLFRLTTNNGNLDGSARVVGYAYPLDGDGERIEIRAIGYTAQGNVILEAPEGYYIKYAEITGINDSTGLVWFTTDLVYDTQYIDHPPQFADVWVHPTYKQGWADDTFKTVVDVDGHEITVVDVPGYWLYDFNMYYAGNVLDGAYHTGGQAVTLVSFVFDGVSYEVPATVNVDLNGDPGTFTMNADGSYEFKLNALADLPQLPDASALDFSLDISYTLSAGGQFVESTLTLAADADFIDGLLAAAMPPAGDVGVAGAMGELDGALASAIADVDGNDIIGATGVVHGHDVFAWGNGQLDGGTTKIMDFQLGGDHLRFADIIHFDSDIDVKLGKGELSLTATDDTNLVLRVNDGQGHEKTVEIQLDQNVDATAVNNADSGQAAALLHQMIYTNTNTG